MGMCARIILLLVFFVLIGLSTGHKKEKYTQKTFGADDDVSITALEKALSALANLTDTQKKVWDQQHAYEQALLTRYKEDEARQAARTTALEEEHQYLRHIWGTFSRKLKAITKRLKNTNEGAQSINERPKDCADLYLDGEDVSGVYQIWPTWYQSNFSIYCDMETDGGGWTVIHRWGNYSFPKDYFNRAWNEYKTGFGNLETAFWLGNNLIHQLTSQGAYELRFDMDGQPANRYSQYRGFWIESETLNFKIHVEGYVSNGTGGDILHGINGGYFSTLERKNSNCVPPRGGWWFATQTYQYSNSRCTMNETFSLSFAPSTSEEHHVFKSEMKIRPASFRKMKETF